MMMAGLLQVYDRRHNKLFVLDKGDRFGDSDVLRPRVQKIMVTYSQYIFIYRVCDQSLYKVPKNEKENGDTFYIF